MLFSWQTDYNTDCDVSDSAVMGSHSLGSDDTYHYWDWKQKVGQNKFFGKLLIMNYEFFISLLSALFKRKYGESRIQRLP